MIVWHHETLPPPVAGEVRMRATAVNLNYIDIYHRYGIYPMTLPSGLVVEAIGVVETVGNGVAALKVGDRVATFGPGLFAYATERVIAADAFPHCRQYRRRDCRRPVKWGVPSSSSPTAWHRSGPPEAATEQRKVVIRRPVGFLGQDG